MNSKNATPTMITSTIVKSTASKIAILLAFTALHPESIAALDPQYVAQPNSVPPTSTSAPTQKNINLSPVSSKEFSQAAIAAALATNTGRQPLTTAVPPAGSPALTPSDVNAPPDTKALSSVSVSVSDTLKLGTTQIFAGKIFTGQRALNLMVTSSIPASATNTSLSSAYSNVESQVATAGLVNLNFNLITTFLPQPYFDSNSTTLVWGDRGQAYDRYYFNGTIPCDADHPESPENISVGKALFYIRDGIGPRVIFRGSSASTASNPSVSNSGTAATTSNINDYGFGTDAYFALGVDGGLFLSSGTLTTSNKANPGSGNFRLEGIATGETFDKTSIERLYPNAVNPKNYSFSYGAHLVFILTNSVNFDIQWIVPVGAPRKYIGKAVIGGFTLSR